MTKNEWMYVVWGVWIVANTVTYLIIRKEWEIIPHKTFGIWWVVVTHSTIIALLIALGEERDK